MTFDLSVFAKKSSVVMRTESDGPYSFHISNFGMLKFCMTIADQGIWDYEEFSWPKDPGQEHFDEHGEPITAEGRAYRIAEQEYLAKESNQPGKVLRRKLASNDPWHLTAHECEILARAVRMKLPVIEAEWSKEWRDKFGEFANTLELATQHDGIDVS